VLKHGILPAVVPRCMKVTKPRSQGKGKKTELAYLSRFILERKPIGAL
jgi:hypothetical protein